MSFAKYKTLLKSLGFQSFLGTQFLGAFNDNVFKIVISMVAVSLGGGLYVSLVGAVFILPFFLFSGYAGYFADRYNKRSVLIVTKSFEIVAVFSGIFALWSGRIEYMLVTLFLMAVHSTFFSPAKYGIIPEMLPTEELSRANGLLEMSTFLAIILGTSVGTLMFAAWKSSLSAIGYIMMVIAISGTAMSFWIGRVANPVSTKTFNINPWSEVAHGIKRLKEDSRLLLSVAAITYFWFLGALLQMAILLLGKEVLRLSDFWIGILITFLALGIGVGSIIAGRLSGDKIEPGLVPLGSTGMGIFSIVLAATTSYYVAAFCLMMLGFFGGLFVVPLNALLQKRSGPAEKGRIIATTNCVGTLSILVASAALWFLRDVIGIPSDAIVLIFGVMTLLGTVILAVILPEFLMRFSLWFLTHTFYKIRIIGKENIPNKGAALLVCNHISFIDWLLLGACVHRFIRFMIYRRFYDYRLVNRFLRLLKAIPISDGGKRETFDSLSKARGELKAGHVVCIFAEGSISRTGNLLPFKKGFTKAVKGLDAPIIPVYLDRVWGSVFSFHGGSFFKKWPQRVLRPITVSFGRPMRPNSDAQEIRQSVQELASDAVRCRRTSDDLLQLQFMASAKRNLAAPCIVDSDGAAMTRGNALKNSILISVWLKKNRPDEGMIAVTAPPSADGAVLNVAVLLAGKTPVNLNATHAADSIQGQCGIKTTIGARGLAGKAGVKPPAGMVYVEDIYDKISDFKKAVTGLIVRVLPYRLLAGIYNAGGRDPDSLAAVIFTGVETGLKGVMLTHHNIISNIEGFSQVLNVSDADVLVAAVPFHYAFGFTCSLWFPLTQGFKTVYLVDPSDALGAAEAVTRHNGTILIGMPRFFEAFIKECPASAVLTLRYAFTGKDASNVPLSISREFKAKFGVSLLEGYGHTELSPVVSINVPDIRSKDTVQRGTKEGTVGHPLPGVAVRVVNPDGMTPVKAGVEGVLLVKGPNLMAGYWKNPELTSSVVTNGWFNTGDFALLEEDGFIRLTGKTLNGREP
ncbi:MAG: MFS transporter [Deltaproteobacteria bacterium]|nr:MFS transporter [Deltaproteobacteria bacterium]